jgi:hypothetical protein
MKNFENLNLGLVELDEREMVELEGGLLGWDDVIIGITIYVGCEILDGIARYANGERIRKK